VIYIKFLQQTNGKRYMLRVDLPVVPEIGSCVRFICFIDSQPHSVELKVATVTHALAGRGEGEVWTYVAEVMLCSADWTSAERVDALLNNPTIYAPWQEIKE